MDKQRNEDNAAAEIMKKKRKVETVAGEVIGVKSGHQIFENCYFDSCSFK